MTPLRVVAALAGACGAAAFTVLTWAVSRAMNDIDRAVNRALNTDPPPDEHQMWVARLRRQAELDALEGTIRRHPAGKRRPR